MKNVTNPARRMTLIFVLFVLFLAMVSVACNDGPTIIDTADNVRDRASDNPGIYDDGQSFQNDVKEAWQSIEQDACESGLSPASCP